MAMSPRLLRPAETGFTPKKLANLGLWLDASVDSSLTFNATTVSEWRDLSGNARNYAQAVGASQPGTGTLSGRRVLSTTGSQFMTGNAATLSLTRNVPGVTVVYVGSLSITDSTQFISFTTNLGQARVLIGRQGNFVLGGRRLDADAFATIGQSGGGVSSGVYTGVLDYANSDAFLFANGSQVASSTSFQTSGNSSDTSSTGAGIFSSATGGQLSTGTMGELIIYSRALSAAERQQVERYLGRKWGITVA